MDTKKMQLTLLCEDRLYGMLLPEKVHGCYWIEDSELEIMDSNRKLVGVEGESGIWKITAGRRLKLFDAKQEIPCLELEVCKMYSMVLSGNRKGYLFTEPYTRDSCTYTKYWVPDNTVLNIGKGTENQMIIDNPYISQVHARLSLAGGVWTIYDNNSKNGIYVNEKRLRNSAVVRPGDVVYLMGVRIVLGQRFLAFNNPDGTVRVNTDVLTKYCADELRCFDEPEELPEKYYYRSPRFYRNIVLLELKIDAPAAKERDDDTPLALSLAPSLVMGAASFSSGIVTMVTTVNNNGNITGAIPTLVMAIAMMTGMVVFPFIMKTRDRKKKREREVVRREKYLKYLANIRAEIYKASNRQQEILNENYPFVLSQMRKADFFDTVLWSRVAGQSNFLTLRIGTGNIPLQARLSFPEQRFGIDDDIMREEVNKFSEEKQIISGVPVVYSLMEHRVSGIVGNGDTVNGMLHQLLIQIAALHSYDEVKLIFLCDKANLDKYNYVRWMPHIWDNDFRMRFLAVDMDGVRSLSAHFLRNMEKFQENQGKMFPHYVVISTSKPLSDGCAFLTELLKDDMQKCFSYLAVYDELKNLPKECSMVIQVNETQGMLFDYQSFDKKQINFVADTATSQDASDAVMEIAEYKLDLQSGKYALPEMLTFLDMYKVGKYEHLNIIGRWKESNPVISLQAPVGVNSDGGLFYLDLHEEAHGPHGLIAGMTGSGKSEFIITYILSMAVNYSPEDVAFILIDYKGGGLVGAFESEEYHLPHIAGTITNLDGAAITRSLLSIQSELKRRQRIFGEARQMADEGTMDIYKYQKLYRSGVVSEPLPHLLIISDEFAELKSQQPEFMEQLISTARIGRSLGVHLILATQKPSGVVSDQIWANSRFKVSLKVQDRADSMDMLKRPDAAELVETGRFYLQVGYNELFELGQSAWCGAPYLPEEHVSSEIDERVQMIDYQGNVIVEAKPQRKKGDSGQARKQIVEIVRYVARIAEEEQIRAQPLWLPEIPPCITVEQLEKKYQYQADDTLSPVIGELDDPYNQEQRLLTMPLTERGNVICYGNASSGKESFLATVLYSLYRSHTSEEVNVYILDFGSETLQMFADAPQTGGVAVSGEDEKIANLFLLLDREVTRRKKLFVSAGGDYLSYRRAGNTDVPAIVTVINEYANFAEQYEALDETMCSLTRECTKYGIYFIVTNLSQMGVRYKLQQNFSQTYVLQMNDSSDYIAILGSTGGVYPSKYVGRGICREKDIHEFQTASITSSLEKMAATVAAFCKELQETGQRQAKPIPVMPKAVYRRHLEETEFSFEKVPLGLNARTAETVCVNLARGNVGQVLAMDRQDIAAFAEGLANLLQGIPGLELYVLDPAQSLRVEGIDEVHYAAEQLEDRIVKLFWLTAERHNTYKKYDGNFPEDVDMHPVVILLMGLGQIRKLLSIDGQDKLGLMLEKTSGKYGLYYWAMDDYQSSNTYCTEDWCKGDGIWIGNGIRDQIRLKVNRSSLMAVETMDYTDGYLIRRTKAEQIKLLLSERMGEETEEDEES